MDFSRLDKIYGFDICSHGGIKEGEEGLIDFSANINPYGPPHNLLHTVKKVAEAEPCISSYPDPAYAIARESVAMSFSEEIKKEQVLLTNGSIELIKLFCEVFIREGDTAIIPVPTFCEYERFTRLRCAQPVFLKITKEFVRTPCQFIKKEIDKKTKAMFLCNPNNPTGAVIEKGSLIELVEYLENENIFVFIDEAFIDFVKNESLIYEVNRFENLVVSRSLTKILGIPGIRIGYGAANDKLLSYLKKAQIPWSINAFAKSIVEDIAQFNNFINTSVSRIGEERTILSKQLAGIRGISVYPSHTNFLLLKVSGMNADILVEELRERGILVRNCENFRGLDGNHIRVAVKMRKDNEKLVISLEEIFGFR